MTTMFALSNLWKVGKLIIHKPEVLVRVQIGQRLKRGTPSPIIVINVREMGKIEEYNFIRLKFINQLSLLRGVI